MTIFYIILAVYLLSIVGCYYLMKYFYQHSVPLEIIQVWAWLVPVVNTLCFIIGFFLAWNYFPVCGLPFWKKRWDKPASPLEKIEESLAYHLV